MLKGCGEAWQEERRVGEGGQWKNGGWKEMGTEKN